MDNTVNGNKPFDSRHMPPHNIEAERSVIGALLLDNASFSKVIDVGLTSQDFYRESHAKIFESIFDLNAKAMPVDMVTVGDLLKNKGQLEQVGGLAYITGLFEDSYSSAHVVHYSKIVKEKAILRRLISASNELVGRAFDGVENVEEFLDFAEKTIFEVTDNKMKNSFSDIKSILIENMQAIQEMSEKKSTVTGLPTGFADLDEKTSGLHGGQLIILAARPAMGKTSFALNIAERASIRAKKAVAVFSLEMSKEELGFRFLSGLAKVSASSLRTGRLQERDWKSLAKAAGTLSESKIFLDDTAALTVLDIRSRCRRLKAEHGLDLVIVDYLQLMQGSSGGRGGAQNREREISEISRGLKMLAKELKVPIIALSQLNRGLENRDDKRPMLSDLRESGAIEQDADIVAFVYRDEVYNKESSDKGIAEVILAKHRAGSVGTIRLSWQAEHTSFEDLAQDYYQQQYQSNQPGAGFSAADDGYYGDDQSMPSNRQPGMAPKGKIDLPNF